MTENHGVGSPILPPGKFKMLHFDQFAPKKLFSWNYLLESIPASSGDYLYLSLIFGAMLLAAVYFLLAKPQKAFRKLYRKISILGFSVSSAGLLIIFCRFELIPYFGSRILLLALFLVFIVWALSILWYAIRILPKTLQKQKEKQEFEKYLPKRKDERKNR